MAAFLIKVNVSCSMSQYIHPRGGKAYPKEGNQLCRHRDIHDRMYWRFQRVNGDYGYIIHNSSGMCMVPESRSETPDLRTFVVLSNTKSPAALFKFDLNNNEIVHKGGRPVTTGILMETGSGTDVGDFIDLGSRPTRPYEIMKFECVSTSNPNQRVNPYQ